MKKRFPTREKDRWEHALTYGVKTIRITNMEVLKETAALQERLKDEFLNPLKDWRPHPTETCRCSSTSISAAHRKREIP
jgi:hypothetical protein